MWVKTVEILMYTKLIFCIYRKLKMNLDMNGRGERTGKGRVMGGREVMVGWGKPM